MRLLLSHEFEPGRYRVIRRFRARLDGSMSITEPKWHGTIEAHAVRSAARLFASDDAIADVNLSYGPKRFRVTRFAA